MSDTKVREIGQNYIVIDEATNRIVYARYGTHFIMERVCERLERNYPGHTFYYDDAEDSHRYAPMLTKWSV